MWSCGLHLAPQGQIPLPVLVPPLTGQSTVSIRYALWVPWLTWNKNPVTSPTALWWCTS
jgi:hypothetical protein